MPTFAPFVLPRYVFILRIVQVILAVIVLGLTAFPAHVFTRDVGDVHESTAFNLFTPSFTILVLIFFFVTPAHFPKVFNRWAVLALESLTWIFWLVAFALMSDFTRKTSWYGKNTSRLLRKRQNSNLDGAYLYDRPEEESSFSSGSGGYSGYSSGYSSGGSSSGYGSSGSFSSADFGGPITTSGVSGWWAMCATASAVGAVTWYKLYS
ncbi:hypothetical protein BJ508DRAFT_17877 [Ascobolus immersus RN42]|uniref:MARVEL domain-containing protein n=1 Tax=Ascobolus immersus RN42 TaxID=1160509 RepID=A0A3N4HT08_ASCIM|nr:hypothetical protein BJ508DRAFT_17877 [Ascobolus immersus RN42]